MLHGLDRRQSTQFALSLGLKSLISTNQQKQNQSFSKQKILCFFFIPYLNVSFRYISISIIN